MNQMRENIENYKASLVVKDYVFARYICPYCSERYGEPEAHGFMDLKRCAECEQKKKRMDQH